MLNELYEKIEAVLNTLDIGGEQSRAFAGEIVLLKEALGYPAPIQDEWDEFERWEILSEKLRRMAVEAEGVLLPLPTGSFAQWVEGTDLSNMEHEEVDLARLLQFLAESEIDAMPK